MARGSPARITRPMAAARTAVQPHLPGWASPASQPRPASRPAPAGLPGREAMGRSCESRRMLSSASGIQLMPATRPKWVTCADIPPAKANENAPRRLARLASRSARRKQNIPSPATAQVAIMLTVHAAVPGTMANSQVSGYAAAAFQPASNGAPLQMYGSNRGRCPARISCPASTRSGRFWVRSSPGRTACPSNAGRPKMTTGSVTSTTTATTSPRPRRGRAPATITSGASADSVLIPCTSAGQAVKMADSCPHVHARPEQVPVAGTEERYQAILRTS